MVIAFQHNDSWLLVNNLRLAGGKGIARSARNAQFVFDGCWTGSEWGATLDGGLRFDSREAAQAYLEQNQTVTQQLRQNKPR
jgi:hypothetical protein